MKKLFYFIMICLTVVALPSCNDKDEIRKEIDELTARLDALQPQIDRLNEQLQAFYPMVEGSIYVSSYTKDNNGDYVLKLSDGTTMKVYSGKPAEDVPTVSINKDGYWCYLLNGQEYIMKDKDGNDMYALPENGPDGKTPKVSVTKEGYWIYSFDDGESWTVFDGAPVANPEKLPSSIFNSVKVDENAGTVTFSLAAGGAPVTVPLYTDMKFEITGGNTISLNAGESENVSITQQNVEQIIVRDTPLGVKVEEAQITIDATGVDAGTYKVYLQIISKNNISKLVLLNVTVN